MSTFVVASDIGGTFTDTVVVDQEGRVGRYKSPTVPQDPASGVLDTLRLAAEDKRLALEAFLSQVTLFTHGTTVATNAMIQGRRAPVGLIQTRGFGDTIAIMRGFKSLGLDEDEIKNFRKMVKQPLVTPKALIAEVTERIGYRGQVIMPLDEDDVRRVVAHLVDQGAEVFAVSLLWSFKNDAHERRVAEIIAEERPGSLVTLSSDVLPRIGEFARSVTVALNASLRPCVREAVGSLSRTLSTQGLAVEPLLMQSNGGLAKAANIDRQAASTVMSGPVGGVMACQYIGEVLGRRNIVTTDMGGTSFDVGLVVDGLPVMSNITRIGRDDIAFPSVAVRTVGAGSGSIASLRNGYLQVGPESAGAAPGPACYGHGGTLATVADADVVLGYINPDNFLGGRLRLNRDLARRAIEEHIARPLGMSVEQAAEGIKTIVDSRMADEVRQVTIQQGFDPADFALMAYGGAGPTHAFSYGAELGMSAIIVPVTASVHSAFGILASDLTAVEELSHPLQSPPGSTDYAAALPTQRLNEIFGELDRRVLGRFSGAGIDPADCRLTRFVEMRFRFQIHALTVPVPELPLDAPAIDQLVGRFIDLYEARFGKGSAFKAAGVELTTFRVVAKATSGRPDLRHHEADGRATPTSFGRRDVFQNGAWTTASIIEGSALRPGTQLDGLAIVELPDTTIVVGAGQQATVDAIGNIIICLQS